MILKILRAILIGAILGIIAVYITVIVIMPREGISDDEVRQIYKNLSAVTGQSQDKLPLVILNQPVINAYTDGDAVYIYRGIIDFSDNKDEVALILGHEIAHNMLRHTHYSEFHSSDLETSVSEANADKVGAFYIMRAGYNLCSARKIWKKLQQQEGDYQGLDHPTFIYRYDQLNINCGREL